MAVQIEKTYELGEFLLNAARRELSRGGEKIHLSNKPYLVLLYLIEHRERMVSRRELLEEFWQGADVYDETLTKCIGTIRKALDDRSETARFIETRYGEGYRYIGAFAEQPIEGQALPIEVERIEIGTVADASATTSLVISQTQFNPPFAVKRRADFRKEGRKHHKVSLSLFHCPSLER